MLETMTIPILLKAVEFLFGEGSNILEERRERRKAQQQETTKDKTAAPSPQASTIPRHK